MQRMRNVLQDTRAEGSPACMTSRARAGRGRRSRVRACFNGAARQRRRSFHRFASGTSALGCGRKGNAPGDRSKRLGLTEAGVGVAVHERGQAEANRNRSCYPCCDPPAVGAKAKEDSCADDGGGQGGYEPVVTSQGITGAARAALCWSGTNRVSLHGPGSGARRRSKQCRRHSAGDSHRNEHARDSHHSHRIHSSKKGGRPYRRPFALGTSSESAARSLTAERSRAPERSPRAAPVDL